MAKMSWSVNVQVSGAPPITAATAARTVEATDRVEVALEPGDTDKVVELQPGGATAIALLLIHSSRYGAAFTFKLSDGTTDTAALTLDAPHVFTGGSAALLGLAPRQLKLTSTSPDQTATVEIFVARDATPP